MSSKKKSRQPIIRCGQFANTYIHMIYNEKCVTQIEKRFECKNQTQISGE